MANSRKKVLKVVFDTNALYTDSASDLIKPAIAQLIRENSAHHDLTIIWYLPDIVVREREYQMRKKGLSYLETLRKLEKLLGHELTTPNIIENRIKDILKEQIEQYNVQRYPLDVAKVNWEQISLDSVYRRPPFDPGDKEKGFRDALVLETFFQIVSESPKSPQNCLIALVSDDQLLGDAIKERISQYQNIRPVKTAEDLKNLINILVSTTTEEFVSSILDAAEKLFFVAQDQGTLFYNERLRESILAEYGKELTSLPKGGDRRENSTWHIATPQFVKKDKQKIFWKNKIIVDAVAYKYLPEETISIITSHANLGTVFSLRSAEIGSDPNSIVLPSQSYLSGEAPTHMLLQPSNLPAAGGISFVTGVPLESKREARFANGTSAFEVIWSVTVSTNKKLSNPKIESILFVQTNWTKVD